MGFKFSKRSEEHLKGVHPDLVRVCRRALLLTKVDFGIIDGLRTPEEQARNVEKGASLTLNSRHLTGHAIDFGVFVAGKYINGDTPEEQRLYERVGEVFKTAALLERVQIRWGGDWKFKDYGHVELARQAYP